VASWIGGNADRSPGQSFSVEQVQLSKLIRTDADEGVDGEQRRKATNVGR
jgi:hypothetical protein